MTNFYTTTFLTDNSLVVTKTKDGVLVNGVKEGTTATDSAATQTTTGTQAPAAAPVATAAPAKGGIFGGSMLMWVVVYVVIIGALYMFSIRPQKKREKEMKELRKSLEVGDNIITSSGYYGKIVDVGTDVFVIEFGTNKGVRIPVNKSDIIGKREPNFAKPEIEKQS